MNILNKEKLLESAKQLASEGKLDRAIREYEKILLADHEDLRVKLRIAELYTKRKQIGDAIRIYKEVADAYASKEFYLKAVTVLKNIIRLNPSMIDINEQLAGLYERMGLTADAIRQYEIISSALDTKGMSDRALAIRARVVDLDPNNGASRIRLAESYQRDGRIDEAIDQYEEYARRLEAAKGEPHKLADLFEKILAHRPNRPEMFRKLVAIYDSLGDNKLAIKWLEWGKNIVDNDPLLLAMAARIYAHQNQNETAKTRYMRMAEIYAEKNNIAAALDAFFEILVLLPDDEDKIANRVDELSPGAMPNLSARAQKRRGEIEAEAARRDEEATREEAKKDREADKLAPSPKISVETKTPDAAPPTSPPPVVEVKVPQKRAVAELKELKAKEPPRDRKIGDGAYDLGMAYIKMGLFDEAEIELAKAMEIYERCIEYNPADDEAKGRISRMTAVLSKGNSDAEIEIAAQPDQIKVDEVEEKSIDSSQKVKSKRKMSFL